MLLFERLVLESLQKKAKNIQRLSADINLNGKIIDNVLSKFQEINLIQKSKENISLNLTNLKDYLKGQNQESLKYELRELFTYIIDLYCAEGKSKFKLRKVYLTPGEEKILQSYWYTIEKFIKNIEQEKRNEAPLVNHKVVFWGEANYLDIINTANSKL